MGGILRILQSDWLISIFLSPDHGHGNQPREAQSEVANWKSEVSKHDKNRIKKKEFVHLETNLNILCTFFLVSCMTKK